MMPLIEILLNMKKEEMTMAADSNELKKMQLMHARDLFGTVNNTDSSSQKEFLEKRWKEVMHELTPYQNERNSLLARPASYNEGVLLDKQLTEAREQLRTLKSIYDQGINKGIDFSFISKNDLSSIIPHNHPPPPEVINPKQESIVDNLFSSLKEGLVNFVSVLQSIVDTVKNYINDTDTEQKNMRPK